MQGELDHLLENTFKVEVEAAQRQKFIQNLPTQIELLTSSTTDAPILLKMTVQLAQEMREQHPDIRISSMNLEDLFIEVTQ